MNAMSYGRPTSVEGPMHQRGFTILEAMVAAGVLSVGLLGLAGLQGMSLGKNVDANDVTRVTNLAADMAERIQNNRQYVLDYHNTDTGVACPQNVSTQRMALGDCAQWQTLVANSRLAGARGVITVTSLDPNPTANPVTMNRFLVTITVSWQTMRTDVSTARTKTVTFTSLVAPE
ncbi:type IV pilus modification protein PilV [Nitrospirales bacterium NOB]|nr:type IV pilus modification protein PilV [Nitrospira sp. NTP2]MDL1888209.1 type IV pilus modification protein PilV [Nitrospirales bacterium NOB]RIK58605.1 MAG: type IV pilus modification protein PilV [Nitrospira sp.]